MSVLNPVQRHSHNCLELAYVVNGWSEHTREGQSKRLVSGDYILIDYHETHSYNIVSDDLVVINCLFQPSAIDPFLRNCRSFYTLLQSYMINLGYIFGEVDARTIFHDNHGEILSLLKKAEVEFLQKHTGYSQIIRAIMIEIIIKTMRKIEKEHLEALKNYDKDIAGIVIALSQNPTGASLTEYAATLNMTPGNLSRKFKNAMGISFSEYLQKKRVEQACRLLNCTNEKVADIAEQVGYNDLKFFYHIFKKVMKVTPKQYRGNYQL